MPAMKRQMISSGNARRERTEDGEDTKQQQVELIDEPAAESVGEFALPGGADEQAEDGGAADRRRLAPAWQNLDLRMNGTSEPNTVKSMTSKKYPAAISATTRR